MATSTPGGMPSRGHSLPGNNTLRHQSSLTRRFSFRERPTWCPQGFPHGASNKQDPSSSLGSCLHLAFGGPAIYIPCFCSCTSPPVHLSVPAARHIIPPPPALVWFRTSLPKNQIVLLKPPSTRPSKSGGGGFLGTVASWWGGGSRNKAGKGKEGVPLSTRLTRLFGRGGGAESSPAKKQGKGRRSSLASRRKSASARRTSEVMHYVLYPPCHARRCIITAVRCSSGHQTLSAPSTFSPTDSPQSYDAASSTNQCLPYGLFALWHPLHNDEAQLFTPSNRSLAPPLVLLTLHWYRQYHHVAAAETAPPMDPTATAAAAVTAAAPTPRSRSAPPGGSHRPPPVAAALVVAARPGIPVSGPMRMRTRSETASNAVLACPLPAPPRSPAPALRHCRCRCRHLGRGLCLCPTRRRRRFRPPEGGARGPTAVGIGEKTGGPVCLTNEFCRAKAGDGNSRYISIRSVSFLAASLI